MWKYLGNALLLGVMTATPLMAYDASNEQPSHNLEVAVTFDAMHSKAAANSSFWLQGGSMQMHGQFWRGLGVVADVAGLHEANIGASGVGLDLVTAVFGPRYTWTPMRHRRYSIYGQALGGVADGLNSIFPDVAGAQTNANGTALQVGGGFNVKWTSRIALRAIEANWVRTDLPNGTTNVQNNLRLGGGFAFRF
jgi:peptidoglycan-associated lipoprotein